MQKRATTYVSYSSLAELKERKDKNVNWLRKSLNNRANFAKSKAMTHRAEAVKATGAPAAAAPGEELPQFDLSTEEGVRAYKAQLEAELNKVKEVLGEDTAMTVTKVNAGGGEEIPAKGKQPKAKPGAKKAAAKKAPAKKTTKRKTAKKK